MNNDLPDEKRTLTFGEAKMVEQGLKLETLSRDGKWYEIDLAFEDGLVIMLLNTHTHVEDLLAGRVVKARRDNGMESWFRLAKVSPIIAVQRRRWYGRN